MRHKTGNGHTHDVDLEKLLDDIKIVVRDGQELLKVSAGEIKQRAIAGARSTDKAIRKSPYQTIGLVFGLGVVIGLLAAGLSGRSHSEELEDY